MLYTFKYQSVTNKSVNTNQINIEWQYFNPNPDSDPDKIYYFGPARPYIIEYNPNLMSTYDPDKLSLVFPVINGYIDKSNMGNLNLEINEETAVDIFFSISHFYNNDFIFPIGLQSPVKLDLAEIGTDLYYHTYSGFHDIFSPIKTSFDIRVEKIEDD